MRGRGGELGPELTNVGRLGRAALVKALVDPDAHIVPGFETWQLTTDYAARIDARILADGKDVTFLDPAGKRWTLPAERILRRERRTVSLMPAAQRLALTEQECADLVAFLLSPGLAVSPPSGR